MGLLDKLWDDTVAGPRPDSGLGRLRKHSFGSRSDAVKAAEATAAEGGIGRLDGDEAAPRVTRSIMIKRPAGCPSPSSGTPPSSPTVSTPPLSPFGGGMGRFRRRSLSDAYERGTDSPKSPNPPLQV